MAQGSLVLFDEFAVSSEDGRFDPTSDTYKVALVSLMPAKSDAVPCWGAGGTTDLSTDEVTPGGGYTAGGKALTSTTFDRSGNISTFDAADVTWTSVGSGDPSNAVAAVLYSDTATNKDCFGFVDLTPDGSTPVSLLVGNIVLKWSASGIFTVTV